MRTLPPALAILALSLLGGCKRQRDARVISAIPLSVSQEIFLTQRTGMEDVASASHLQIDWNGPGAGEQQRQIDLISEAVRSRRYGITVTPSGGTAIDTVLQDALHRQIPVVMLRDSTTLRDQPHLSFVLEDYQDDAELVVKRLQSRWHCKGTVLIVGVDNYSDNSVRRLDALEGTFRRECPLLQVAEPVVAPYGSGVVQLAAKQALSKYPDLIAFIGLNPRASLGAEVVAESSPQSHVDVIAFDQSLPLLLRLRRGFVTAIVAQNMRAMGSDAVENILADRDGQPYQHRITLPPKLITAENVDTPEVQNWLQFNPEQTQ